MELAAATLTGPAVAWQKPLSAAVAGLLGIDAGFLDPDIFRDDAGGAAAAYRGRPLRAGVTPSGASMAKCKVW